MTRERNSMYDKLSHKDIPVCCYHSLDWINQQKFMEVEEWKRLSWRTCCTLRLNKLNYCFTNDMNVMVEWEICSCSCLTDSKHIFHHTVVPAEGRHDVSHISSGLMMADACQSRRDVCSLPSHEASCCTDIIMWIISYSETYNEMRMSYREW